MRDRDLTTTDDELYRRDQEACATPGAGHRFASFPKVICDHAVWTWKKDGRVCPSCGTFVVDFGD